nr:natterin-1-like [Anolis sagrei ordinatus]
MDFRMHSLLCSLFLSLIVNEPWANGEKIRLTTLNKMVKKGPIVTIVQGSDTTAAMNPTGNKNPSDRNSDAFYETALSWVPFQGLVPSDAVSFWNDFANRTEYPCREPGCSAGFYSPSLGPYCFFPYGSKEYKSSQFWLLVNEYNLESFIWEFGRLSAILPNSIYTCPGVKVYVAKNSYGLGKVDGESRMFYIGIDGKEQRYIYREILTVKKDYKSQSIKVIQYMQEQGTYSEEPVVLVSSQVTNNGCNAMKKSTTLSGIIRSEHQWAVDISLPQSMSSITLTAGIPEVIGVSWNISSENTFRWSKDSTQSESITHSETVEVNVPPKQSCEVVMEGRRMTARIPFTAIAIRNYQEDVPPIYPLPTVQGISHNVIVAQVHMVVKQCQPIPNANPCHA